MTDPRRPGWRVDGAQPLGRPIPSEEQVLALADAAPTEQFRAYVLTAAFSGLRLFEVAALTGDCVHPLPDGGCRLEVMSGKGGYYGESALFQPGTKALLDVLREAPDPPVWPRPVWEARVFSTPSGERWDRKSVSKVWVKMRDGLGLPFTFHTLRHFHATWLLDMGVPDLDVSLQLRHRDHGELVRKVYGHPRARLALDRIEAKVDAARGGSR